MQVAGRSMQRLVGLLGASALLIAGAIASAEDETPIRHRQADSASPERLCKSAIQDPGSLEEFESVQVETSDITRHEQFFEFVLHAAVVQRMEHPQVDRFLGYCYRGVLIGVRQDLRTPRPTGWVQINFTVPDIAAVQEEVEGSYRASMLSQLAEEERTKIVRVRLKPEVTRGHRKATRFEVTGPEGFMIGFDQYK